MFPYARWDHDAYGRVLSVSAYAAVLIARVAKDVEFVAVQSAHMNSMYQEKSVC